MAYPGKKAVNHTDASSTTTRGGRGTRGKRPRGGRGAGSRSSGGTHGRSSGGGHTHTGPTGGVNSGGWSIGTGGDHEGEYGFQGESFGPQDPGGSWNTPVFETHLHSYNVPNHAHNLDGWVSTEGDHDGHYGPWSGENIVRSGRSGRVNPRRMNRGGRANPRRMNRSGRANPSRMKRGGRANPSRMKRGGRANR